MTTISPHSGAVVALSFFGLDGGNQENVLAQIGRRAEAHARGTNGFVSANLHVSLDATRVANYEQWRTRAGFDGACGPVAAAADVVLCEIAHVEEAADGDPHITAGSSPFTLIVTMKCEPAEQAEFVGYLIGIAREHRRENDGFVSCTIHRSFDGTRAVEYIQWRDQAVLGAMMAKPSSQAHFKRVQGRSVAAPYRVVQTISTHPPVASKA